MESEGAEITRKLMKPDSPGRRRRSDIGLGDDAESQREEVAGSEEVELAISQTLEKIDQFTEQISEPLESQKAMFKRMSDEFEEKLILIHKEQMEKWQVDIRELRMIDASNEEAGAVLHNATYLLQNPNMESNSGFLLQNHAHIGS